MRFTHHNLVTLALVVSILGGLLVGPMAQLQQLGAQEATPAVTSYDEVAGQYAEMRDAAVEEGRRITEQLLKGETEEVFDRMAPEVQDLIEAAELDSLVADLQSDRVRFVIPAVSLIFNGHLEGDSLSGFVTGSGTAGFETSRTPESAGEGLLSGTWDGTISAGTQSFGLQLTIEGADERWSGTASIADWQVLDAELEEITFIESQSIGERLGDRALPYSSGKQAYWARHAWGVEPITFQYAFDQNGMLTLAQIAPEETLPPFDEASAVTGLVWPLVGLWWVGWGGDSVLENYHAVVPSQRFALDLLVWKDGATFSGDGTANEDYWAWGQPVFVPVAGSIVDVVEGIPDNIPGELNSEVHPAGNHVVLQSDDQSFIYLAHFQEGSIGVEIGEQVKAGQQLGLVGNSGNSSEPHLHIHAQSVQEFDDPGAVGLPLVFATLSVDGVLEQNARAVQGSFVSQGS